MTSPVETTQSFDLHEYLSELKLQSMIPGPCAPPIPPPGVRSNFMPLTIQPAGYRKLQLIEPLMYDICCEAAAYFSKSDAFDSGTMKGLKLPILNEIPEDCDFNPYFVNSVTNVTNLLTRFLLRSIEMLLENIDDTMREWKFQTVPSPRELGRDIQSPDPIVLCRTDEFGYRNFAKLIMVPLAPWEFTRKDFEEFFTKQRFDDYAIDPDEDEEDEELEWVGADRLRAYLYDICLNFDCPHFVVTSHEQWSFGSFSTFYTTAFMSPPIPYDHQPTSIVELLMYWVHVAFGKPNTIPTPSVDNEENLRPEMLQKERQLRAKKYLGEGVLGMGPGLVNPDSVPEKRKHCAITEDDNCTTEVKRPRLVEYAKVIRRRGPPRLFKMLEKLVAETARQKSTTRSGIKGEISCDASVAPSCAEHLPKTLIPRRKNAAIQRWRELVATVEELGEFPQGTAFAKSNWVDVLACDPTTGELTGDIQRIDDHTCSSCGPPSETLSECSLTEEERARWALQPDTEIYGMLPIYQWY